MTKPVKTITTVQTVDESGAVLSETVTTTVIETVKEAPAAPNGMYL